VPTPRRFVHRHAATAVARERTGRRIVSAVFTGIVREVGRVEAVEPAPNGGVRLHVAAPATAPGTGEGDSVAVAGVCLTATAAPGADGTLAFDAVPETLARTTLGDLAPGDPVNLEPALRAGDPLGGHVVQGHVDGVATVTAVVPEGDGTRLALELPDELERLAVEKGSIALDGVSLTIAALDGPRIEIALVPHTLAGTTLGRAGPGARLNVEADILAKHVERLLEARVGPVAPRYP
jgi:riboflavin synthase alpha subunit